LSLVHNERTKLTATALNNVAVALIVTGFVVPVVGLGQRTDLPAAAGQLWFSFVWLVTGSVVHYVARLMLGSLKP
jgi:hypothetical protein